MTKTKDAYAFQMTIILWLKTKIAIQQDGGMVKENGFPSDKLQEVKVKRVPLARCNSVLSYGGTKDETMTCAGYAAGGKDAYQNDSGGSMVCKVNCKFLKQIYFFCLY